MVALYITLGIVGFLLLADIAIAWYFIFKYLWRSKKFDERERIIAYGDSYTLASQMMAEGLDWLDTKVLEDVHMTSHDGLQLCARLLRADKPSDNYVICVHGYHSSPRMDYGSSIRFLHDCGCNVLLPDNRSHGQSEGGFCGFSYLDSRDCISWCRYIEARFGADSKILLIGISMGGATVLSAAGDKELPLCVRGVVSDCAFSSGWDELAYQMKRLFKLPTFPILHTVDLLLRIFAGYSLRKNTAVQCAKNIKVPLLIIHGRADDFVPTRMASEIYEAAKCDKRLLLVDGAKHGISYCVAPELYREAVKDAMERAGMAMDENKEEYTNGQKEINQKLD